MKLVKLAEERGPPIFQHALVTDGEGPATGGPPMRDHLQLKSRVANRERLDQGLFVSVD
jgi:hypothetical protein